jgi:enamine deaminase RidA (YjgF/YER057c/UK114 family)
MWNYWLGSGAGESIELETDLLLKNLKKDLQEDRAIKLTFYTCCSNQESYRDLKSFLNAKVRKVLDYPVLVSLIPQTPVNRLIYLEAWSLKHTPDLKVEHQQKNGANFLKVEGKFQLLIVSADSLTGNVDQDAAHCFSSLKKIVSQLNFPFSNLFRQWNYIGRITDIKEDKQNYQLFNEARANAFAGEQFTFGYPSATGIGMDIPGVVLEACFLNSNFHRQVAIRNPAQLSPHAYSDKVLISSELKKSTPKFERARALMNGTSSFLFISGTAAISGENSSESADPEEQTRQTLLAIDRLVEPENLNHYTGSLLESEYKYRNVRVYLKNGYLNAGIESMISSFFHRNEPLFLAADICRENLLVEIEAELDIIS